MVRARGRGEEVRCHPSAVPTCPSTRPPTRARRRRGEDDIASARAWYGMLVSMVSWYLTIQAIMLRQSPVHRPLVLMKPVSVPRSFLRKSFRASMTCAIVGMVDPSWKSVSTMPTKLSPVSLAPAKMSLNLIEHMQLHTTGQRACGGAQLHSRRRRARGQRWAAAAGAGGWRGPRRWHCGWGGLTWA